jgi:4-oxalocrotonate tautomerase
VPLIRISHAANYSNEDKETIMREVTAAYAAAARCDPSKVWLLLEEVPGEDWATGGVSLAAKRNGSPALT